MCVMKVPVKSWLCCLSVNGSKWARNSTFTFKPSSRWLVDWRRHPIIKRHGLSLSASVSLLRLFCEPWVHIDTRRGDTRCKHSVCVWSPVVLLSIEDTGHFLPSQMSLHLSTNESHEKNSTNQSYCHALRGNERIDGHIPSSTEVQHNQWPQQPHKHNSLVKSCCLDCKEVTAFTLRIEFSWFFFLSLSVHFMCLHLYKRKPNQQIASSRSVLFCLPVQQIYLQPVSKAETFIQKRPATAASRAKGVLFSSSF